jgi:cytochrome d ubiquinol oxidase subunit II
VSSGFASIDLPEIVAGIMVLALNAYVLMGGADFGGGVWDLFAGGPRRDSQRELITKSIAPIWEANHVWLIVVVVLMFTAFPVAFSTLAIVLHIPITLMLIGIVLRGSAFVFRSYGSRTGGTRRRWGIAFAAASTVTPVLLGMIIGSIATGDVATAYGRIGAASFAQIFVWPWLAPFPIAVGLFALALFAFLAAIYLTIEAKDDDALRDDFRARALVVAAASLHRRGRGDGYRFALATQLPSRASRRGGAGEPHSLGMGSRAIPVHHPRDGLDSPSLRPRGDVDAAADWTRRRCAGPHPVVAISVADVRRPRRRG